MMPVEFNLDQTNLNDNPKQKDQFPDEFIIIKKRKKSDKKENVLSY
jgi:hypothetical protein